MHRMWLLVALSLFLTLSIGACAGNKNSASTVPGGGVSPVSGRTLPPEPDPAVNKATIAGVDSNNDGLRDDVERWLDEKYGGDKKKLSGVRKYARSAQRDIVEVDKITAETRSAYSKKGLKEGDCFIEFFGGTPRERESVREQIIEQTFNTIDRIKIKRASDKKFNGLMFGLSKAEENAACTEE